MHSTKVKLIWLLFKYVSLFCRSGEFNLTVFGFRTEQKRAVSCN